MSQSNFTKLSDVEAVFTVSTVGTFIANNVDVTGKSIYIASHGLGIGDAVSFTNSGGGLPGGVSANTAYYAIPLDQNTFSIGTSRANAVAGTKVAITTVGTGTQTATKNAMGIVLSSAFIPNKGILTLAINNPVTAFTSSGAATVAFAVGAQSLEDATAYNDGTYTSIQTMPKVAFVTTPTQLSADSQVTMTVAVAALTAGDYSVYLQYIQGR